MDIEHGMKYVDIEHGMKYVDIERKAVEHVNDCPICDGECLACAKKEESNFRQSLKKSVECLFVPTTIDKYVGLRTYTNKELDAMSPLELWNTWIIVLNEGQSACEPSEYVKRRKAFYKSYGIVMQFGRIEECFLKRNNTDCIFGSAMKHFIKGRSPYDFNRIRLGHAKYIHFNIDNVVRELQNQTVQHLVVIDSDSSLYNKINIMESMTNAHAVFISQQEEYSDVIVSLLFENVPNRIFFKTFGSAKEETDHTISTLFGILHNILPNHIPFTVISHDRFVYALQNIYKMFKREFNAIYVYKGMITE